MEERKWIRYEERPIRQGKKVLYTEYRFIEILPLWWKASGKEPNGQMTMCWTDIPVTRVGSYVR